MKLIIDIDEEMYKRICEAQSVPDIYGTDIVNTLNRIREGTPHEEVAYSAIKNDTPYNPAVDLISREDLRKEVTEKVHFMTVDGHIAYDKVLKLIDSAPTVDVIPNEEGYEMYGKGYCKGHLQGYEKGKNERPKGEWIEHSLENLLWGHNECPFCHMRSNRGAHYCQYCGAYMKSEEEDVN